MDQALHAVVRLPLHDVLECGVSHEQGILAEGGAPGVQVDPGLGVLVVARDYPRVFKRLGVNHVSLSAVGVRKHHHALVRAQPKDFFERSVLLYY